MTRVWWFALAAATAVLIAAGFAMWYVLLPPLPVAKLEALQPDQLPAPSPRADLAAAQSALTARPLWGRDASTVGPASTDLPWRFVGAVGVGTARATPAFVLISIGDQEPEIRRVGDALPGGAIITRIRHDQICVRVDGRERTLPLSSL
jgi:Type II secretion system protein C